MYYIFDTQSWESFPARILNTADSQSLWWDDGESFEHPPVEPIKGVLKPYKEDHPSMSRELGAYYYDSSIPFFRDDLLQALQEAGVDNLDVYEAELTDPDTGEVHTNFKAINILGLVAAADMAKSEAIVHDGIPLVDVSFNKLVLDPTKTHDFLLFRSAENNGTILIHESVKKHLENKGFNKLSFYELDKAAI
ncbi:MAG: hypothetical protein H6999_11115 [Hahellaceae bacterium]|nr:hypothetical protein [Hahellaceae bacterium]